MHNTKHFVKLEEEGISFIYHQKYGSHFINELKGWWASCFVFFSLINPFMCRDLYPHSPPPPQLLVVSHVAVMVLLLLFTTGRLMLIFALPWLSVLCWLFTSSPPSPCSPSPLCSQHCLCLTCNNLFHAFFLIFILNLPSPISLPFSPSFFNACDVCIGLFWCDQSSTPKFMCKIKTPAHPKTLHHDWLLPPGDDLPCPLPPPLCPPLACPALIGGCFLVPSLWLAVLMANV